MVPQFIALSLRIQEVGPKTQNHDKGLDRLIRKFDSEVPMTATTAVAKGYHEEHGLAVYGTQESRRCLLLETIY
jgi:hypothetical protein